MGKIQQCSTPTASSLAKVPHGTATVLPCTRSKLVLAAHKVLPQRLEGVIKVQNKDIGAKEGATRPNVAVNATVEGNQALPVLTHNYSQHFQE
jgi:hypothetical protein